MPREQYREEGGYRGGGRFREEREGGRFREDEDYGRRRSSRYDEDEGNGYERRSSRRGYSEDVGQGGWFGDYEGHSEIGRRGGEVRHERAMRARHDLDEPEHSSRRGRSSRYDEDEDYGRRRGRD